MPADTERRDGQRAIIDGKGVSVQVDDDPPVRAQNISIGGLLLATKKRYPIGNRVRVRLTQGDWSSNTHARVTHIQRGAIGLAFADTTDQFRGTIACLIDRLLSADDQGDRRASVRVPVTATVFWSVGDDADSEQERAALEDLSSTGAKVSTDVPPDMGAEVYLYLPGFTYSEGTAEPSELRGCSAEVVRQFDGGFAVHFSKPSAEFTMAIAEIIRREQIAANA